MPVFCCSKNLINMQKPHKFVFLALFCVVFQSLISLGVKYAFTVLGDEPAIFPKLLLYSISFALMAVYAVLWQLVLKFIDLSFANSTMSMVPVLVFLGGIFLFNEKINTNNGLGFFMIIAGLLMIFNSKRRGLKNA